MQNSLTQLWQQFSPYMIDINFIIFIPLIFILRSVVLKRLKKTLGENFKDNQMYPFVLSLVNWGTFYAICFYAIAYYKNTFWLGKTWFTVGHTPINTLTFLIPLLIIGLAFKASDFISAFLLEKVYDRYELDRGMRFTFNRLFHYVLMLLSVLVALPAVGFDLSVLKIFAGVLGIGVGFGLKNIVSNFISGLIILFERPIKVGDIIVMGDVQCEVEYINIRATVARTFDNHRIIIPNSQFIENQVVNWSYGDQKMREQIPIGIAYGSDVRLAEKLLLQAAAEQENVLVDPKPRVDFLNFGDSSLDLRLIYWIPQTSVMIEVKNNLNFRIYELFNQYQIEIPYPQQDLHLRSVDDGLLQNLQVEIGNAPEIAKE